MIRLSLHSLFHKIIINSLTRKTSASLDFNLQMYRRSSVIKIREMLTHFGWPSDIGLKLGSVLLLKVSGSNLSSANLRG